MLPEAGDAQAWLKGGLSFELVGEERGAGRLLGLNVLDAPCKYCEASGLEEGNDIRRIAHA